MKAEDISTSSLKEQHDIDTVDIDATVDIQHDNLDGEEGGRAVHQQH
jgi:hypothetical protein